MKHSQAEILKALHIIKETCEGFIGCNGCPFDRMGECLINNRYPEDWKISDETPKVWKGLL